MTGNCVRVGTLAAFAVLSWSVPAFADDPPSLQRPAYGNLSPSLVQFLTYKGGLLAKQFAGTGLTGTNPVTVAVDIKADGYVTGCKLSVPSENTSLDRAVCDMFVGSKFQPVLSSQGKPMATTVTVEVPRIHF